MKERDYILKAVLVTLPISMGFYEDKLKSLIRKAREEKDADKKEEIELDYCLVRDEAIEDASLMAMALTSILSKNFNDILGTNLPWGKEKV